MSESDEARPQVPGREGLIALRDALRGTDRAIIEQLAERMRLIGQVASYKVAEGLPAFDREREQAHLGDLLAMASAQGLAPELARDVFGVLFAASRAEQRRAQRVSVDPFRIGIVGGTAGMGEFLARVCTAAGHTVEVSGIDQVPSNIEIAARNDLVVIAVPIAATEQVIREVAPVLRAGACLMDVTSIKAEPLAAMLAMAPESVSVLGTHPMFGTSGQDFDRQKVVLCRGRGDEWFTRIKRLYELLGAECIEATAEEHDAQMALIQVLVHEKTMVLGSVLERLKASLSRSLQFASPIYRTELAMVGRMFSQGADLYADILTKNKDAARYSHVFEQEAAHFARAVAMGDRDTVIKRFKEVSVFMADFATWAKTQSDAILQDLVRHG
jgi:chorismate mutase / prephenate dehydrogenase